MMLRPKSTVRDDTMFAHLPILFAHYVLFIEDCRSRLFTELPNSLFRTVSTRELNLVAIFYSYLHLRIASTHALDPPSPAATSGPDQMLSNPFLSPHWVFLCQERQDAKYRFESSVSINSMR